MDKISKALLKNGITLSKEPSKKAGYITRDGFFIDLEANSDLIERYCCKEVTHYDFAVYLRKIGLTKRISQAYPVEELGFIKLNDGGFIYMCDEAYIELPPYKATRKQYKALLSWLDVLTLTSDKKYISIGIGNRGQRYDFLGKKNQDGLLPEEIIKLIKLLYKKR